MMMTVSTSVWGHQARHTLVDTVLAAQELDLRSNKRLDSMGHDEAPVEVLPTVV